MSESAALVKLFFRSTIVPGRVFELRPAEKILGQLEQVLGSIGNQHGAAPGLIPGRGEIGYY